MSEPHVYVLSLDVSILKDISLVSSCQTIVAGEGVQLATGHPKKNNNTQENGEESNKEMACVHVCSFLVLPGNFKTMVISPGNLRGEASKLELLKPVMFSCDNLLL